MASPSERAKTERASRISAREDDGGEGIRIDIAAGSVYLAIVPWRDPMDKRPPIRRFRNRTYSPPSSGLSGGRKVMHIRTAPTPTGTLTKKIQRQSTLVTR